MRILCLVISIIIFCFNVPLLMILYPNAETDYNEFLMYYYAKESINEVLVCLLFLFAFLSTEHRFMKALSIFGFSVTFSSTIDKIFLQNFDYLYTDLIIVVASLILAIRTFRNGNT